MILLALICQIAIGVCGRNPRLFLRHRLEGAQEAVAEIVGQGDAVGGDHRAVRLLDAHIAEGVEGVGLAIVDELVGEESVVLVIDLDIALCGDEVVVVVGGEFVGLKQEGEVRAVLVDLRREQVAFRKSFAGLARYQHRKEANPDESAPSGHRACFTSR